MKKAIILSLLLALCVNQALLAAETLSEDISAQTLITGITQNNLRFNKQYKGSQLNVSGYVGSLKERKDGYMLTLQGDKGRPMPYIECRFDVSEEDKLLELNRGDEIRIEGIYRGNEELSHGVFVLYRCHVLN